MANIKMICSSCGGAQEVDDCNQFISCIYCATKVMIAKEQAANDKNNNLRSNLKVDVEKRKAQSKKGYIVGGIVSLIGIVLIVVDSIGESERTALFGVGIGLLIAGALIAFVAWGHTLEGSDKLKELCKECDKGLMRKVKSGEKATPTWKCSHCGRVSHVEGM